MLANGESSDRNDGRLPSSSVVDDIEEIADVDGSSSIAMIHRFYNEKAEATQDTTMKWR